MERGIKEFYPDKRVLPNFSSGHVVYSAKVLHCLIAGLSVGLSQTFTWYPTKAWFKCTEEGAALPPATTGTTGVCCTAWRWGLWCHHDPQKQGWERCSPWSGPLLYFYFTLYWYRLHMYVILRYVICTTHYIDWRSWRTRDWGIWNRRSSMRNKGALFLIEWF